MLTAIDFYCGAGGSSSGMEQVPGVQVRYASNHWDLALKTHNENLPHVEHDIEEIPDQHPSRYPRTDIAWFSPECTTWSGARGEKCDYDAASKQLDLLDEDDEPESEEAKRRSRAQMQDVPRITAHHRYRAVIVENVPDIMKWADLDGWIADMRNLNYRCYILHLNSAFAGQLGAPAPQLRNRVYVMFIRREYRAPDLDKWFRPRAWCPTCETVVRGIQVIKPGPRRPISYGERRQYVYRCPSVTCRNSIVHPYVLPALTAVDLTMPSLRIGDRKTPLQPATLARIEAGLRRYAYRIVDGGNVTVPPLLSPAGGTWNEEATSVTQPMRTRTTRETEAVVVPPFLTPLRSGRPRTIPPGDPMATVVADGSHHYLVDPMLVPTVGAGRDGVRARPVTQPAGTQTGRHETALVVPLRNNGVGRPADQHPLPAFTAGATHHAFVTAAQHAVYSYDTGLLRPLALPLPTQTAVEGDALLGLLPAVDDCTFRMLDIPEIRDGMAFARTFRLPYGARRDRVRMLGNAVTPNAARDLVACVVEAITGDEFELVA